LREGTQIFLQFYPHFLSFVDQFNSMKKVVILAVLAAFSIPLIAQETSQRITQDIQFLSSDQLEGRETGSPGAAIAAGYIASRFQSLGLNGISNDFYFQEFAYRPRLNPHSTKTDTTQPGKTARNVVGYLDNKAATTIVIGAHYDHLGHGGEGSLHAAKDGQIHNGADDNASGVALVLYLADQLSAEKYKKSNYLFIAFSGEEKGLLGSNYFAKNPLLDLNTVNYMLNFDMVGRFHEDKGLAVNGVGTASEWKTIIEKSNKNSLKLIQSESGIGPSDHTSFYLQDIPVLHFFTGQHEDYHKPSDDADKINYDGVEIIGGLVEEIIAESLFQDRLTFQKTKEEKNSTPRFTVTLGVMPDYLYDGDGMRIDGIIEDRPAQKAGLQKGDVVVQLGDISVDGMQTYMEALSKFKKGDQTKVKIKRDKEIIEADIKF